MFLDTNTNTKVTPVHACTHTRSSTHTTEDLLKIRGPTTGQETQRAGAHPITGLRKKGVIKPHRKSPITKSMIRNHKNQESRNRKID